MEILSRLRMIFQAIYVDKMDKFRGKHITLKVVFKYKLVVYSPNPKHIGVMIDRSLNFRGHPYKTTAKHKTTNNILHKISGSSRETNASIVKTSALALVYSAAKYCYPLW